MKQSDKKDLETVEGLLNDARQVPVDLPPGLTARVLMDAERVQLALSANQPSGWSFHRLLDAIGGWPALSGLAAASCIGFWIGISPLEGIVDPANLFFGQGTETYDGTAELTGFGWDILEG